MYKQLSTILVNNDKKLTSPRKNVFKVLYRSSTPLSTVRIVQLTDGIDKVSVYRILDMYLELGIVVEVFKNSKRYYELNSPFRVHHHHLNCIKCDSVTSIVSKEIEEDIKNLCLANKFEHSSHQFEINGICARCSNGY